MVMDLRKMHERNGTEPYDYSRSSPYGPDVTYKDINFMKSQIKRLAKQLFDAHKQEAVV
jgi:hypothetical protein